MKLKQRSVFIVDDDDSFRNSLEELLGLMGFNVAGFDSAEGFLKQGVVPRPACLLLDVYLPGLNGLTLQQKLRDSGVDVPVIFISGHGDVPMSVNAMKNGAVDFLLKPIKKSDLNRAVIAAIELDKANYQRSEERKKILSRVSALTPREQDVMREIITGKLNKQIAVVLGTAEKTIRKHRGQVMKKMKVSSVADLVRILAKINIVHS